MKTIVVKPSAKRKVVLHKASVSLGGLILRAEGGLVSPAGHLYKLTTLAGAALSLKSKSAIDRAWHRNDSFDRDREAKKLCFRKKTHP